MEFLRTVESVTRGAPPAQLIARTVNLVEESTDRVTLPPVNAHSGSLMMEYRLTVRHAVTGARLVPDLRLTVCSVEERIDRVTLPRVIVSWDFSITESPETV